MNCEYVNYKEVYNERKKEQKKVDGLCRTMRELKHQEKFKLLNGIKLTIAQIIRKN